VFLTGADELTSTSNGVCSANHTKGLQAGFSLNEYVGHGWFFVTEFSLGAIRYELSPDDRRHDSSGTMRVALGFMRR
jgi:hypothetical protein